MFRSVINCGIERSMIFSVNAQNLLLKSQVDVFTIVSKGYFSHLFSSNSTFLKSQLPHSKF